MKLATKYRSGSVGRITVTRDELLEMYADEKLELVDLAFLNGVTTLDSPAANRLVFLERCTAESEQALSAIDRADMLFIVPSESPNMPRQPRMISSAPRAAYTKLVDRIFGYELDYWSQCSRIDPSASIGPEVRMMPGVIVGRNSIIGAGCVIYPNVVIGPNCNIGERCIIKSGSVIGQPGFGVFKDSHGQPHHFPHVGGVVIEHDVEIGALNTVCAGSIHPTVVGEFAKFDDHVHVAHNCVIGRRTLITACAELSGSVIVGDDCWIGPNASIIDGVTIGDRAFIGIGSNVTKSIADGVVAAGNPARQIRTAT
jgi:UDP-3-O-[3-hydroxymyristoyl] glucosamine N-acyltransferase